MACPSELVSPTVPGGSRLTALLAAGLMAANCAAYYPVLWCDFVTFDDPTYVTKNESLHKGLSGEGIVWALGADLAANWHPLTLLSLHLDYELFGLRPFGYHLHNLLLHLANTLLLFLILRRLTGAPGRSACVAALFALHPLHVESVAWVSERKDLLSTLFGLLALRAYLWYAAAPSGRRNLAVTALFVLSLLAKPMWVTFPFLLLLLDYWPLSRWQRGAVRSLLVEKVPLCAFAALFSAIALVTQKHEGAVPALEGLPVGARIVNAALSYAAYLRQMVVPIDLAVFYPHPGAGFSPSGAAAVGMLLLAATLAALWYARTLPYLFVGWFWYLGTLVPVIGLVQVGAQARADRYTYLPLVGIFLALVWGIGDLLDRVARPKFGVALAVLALSVCGVLTHLQLAHWRNGVALWEQAVRVQPDNSRALQNLGGSLLDSGDNAGALARFDDLRRLNPNDALNHSNRGEALLRMNRLDEAEEAFRTALLLSPSLPYAQQGLWTVGERRKKMGHEPRP